MMRHRFRAADPYGCRSLRNDGGIAPRGRSGAQIGCRYSRPGPGLDLHFKTPHITALRLDWLFTPTGGKEPDGFRSSEKSRHSHHPDKRVLRRSSCLS